MKALANDFPDWMGAMLVKELRQGLKTRAFEWSFVFIQFALVILVCVQAFMSMSERDARGFNPFATAFWVLVGAHLLVITPARALTDLSGERAAGTLELLLVSGLSARGIAVGKWATHLFQATLFLVAVLPYAILRYFLGAVNLVEDLHWLLTQLALCAVLSACALAVSARVRQKHAGGVAILVIFIVPRIFAALFGRHFFHFSSGSLDWLLWCVLALDGFLICVGALEATAAVIAPLAARSVTRTRVLTLLGWLPIPCMLGLGADPAAADMQLTFFAAFGAALTFRDFLTHPRSLNTPPAGVISRWRVRLGAIFQPGWPGAVLFVALMVALAAARLLFGAAGPDSQSLIAGLAAAAAALEALCLLRVIVTQPRRSSAVLVSRFALGLLYALPAIALLFFIGSDLPLEYALPDALLIFTGYTAVLCWRSRRYWARYFELCSPLPGHPLAARAN